MTTVGKIFAVIVMVMSLAVSGLIVVWYTKTLPYSKLYADARSKIDLAYKDAETSAQQVSKIKAEAKVEADRQSELVKKLQDDITARDLSLAALKKQKEEIEADKLRLTEVADSARAESGKRALDVEQIRVTLDKEQKRNNELLAQADVLRKDKVQAEIQASTFRERNQQLEKQVELLAKENAKLGTARTGGGTLVASTKNPPTEDVQGSIREMDAKGLYTISIGSDAGLSRGQTLEAFRMDEKSGKYLGTVRILEVSATQAVVQPMGKVSAPLKVGDRVASRILGSN